MLNVDDICAQIMIMKLYSKTNFLLKINKEKRKAQLHHIKSEI